MGGLCFRRFDFLVAPLAVVVRVAQCLREIAAALEPVVRLLRERFFRRRVKEAGSVRSSEDGGAGFSDRTFVMTVVARSPVNGFSPVRNWYSTTPAEKRSERPSTGCPSSCSGDM
jgi:hypothetical protein